MANTTTFLRLNTTKGTIYVGLVVKCLHKKAPPKIMAGKKNKKRSEKSGIKEKNGSKKVKGAKKASVKKSEGKSKSAKSRCNVDIFTEACMENAYYICHNVQDVLKCRGFPWPDATNKKKKEKKGK